MSEKEFELINNSSKVYHAINTSTHRLLFDYEKMIILKSNDILNSFLDEDIIDDSFIGESCTAFGSDSVDTTLCQIREMINKDVIFKTNYKNAYQHKPLEFIHAEISFPTVHSCNLHCRYCFASAGENFNQNSKSVEFSKHLMQQAIDYFVTSFAPNAKYYRIDFVGGGEPLLNFEVIEATYLYSKKMEEQIKKPIKVWMCTNGTVFDDAVLENINSMNLSIGVSLDGNEEKHDSARQYINGNGTYNDVMSGIEKIRSNNNYSKKFKDVWILSVLHGLNLNVLQILDHHTAHGFTTVQMKPVRLEKSHELSINNDNIDELINQYRLLKDYIIKNIEVDNLNYLRVILNDNDYLGRIIISLIIKQKTIYRCGAGKYKISISANGDIYPCDSFVGKQEYRLGNIKEKLLDENILQQFSEAHVFNRKPCCECWNKYLCGGDCYYNSVLVTNSLNGIDPIICKLKKCLSEFAIEIVYELSKKSKTLDHLSRFVFRRRNFKMQGDDKNAT